MRIRIQNDSFEYESEPYNGSYLRIEQDDEEICHEAH